MSIIKKNKEKYFSFNGKKYAFNLEKLREVCLTSSSDNGGRELELTTVYEPTSDGDYAIASKVEHETKVSKTLQNDMIVYDFVKMFILTLLENEVLHHSRRSQRRPSRLKPDERPLRRRPPGGHPLLGRRLDDCSMVPQSVRWWTGASL